MVSTPAGMDQCMFYESIQKHVFGGHVSFFRSLKYKKKWTIKK